jgi:hypothetical protein
MEHARVTLITGDPACTGDLVRFVGREVRRRLEEELGYLNLSALVNDELGVVVVESFWVSGDAMRATEHVEAPLRKEALHRGGATVSVEHFAVPTYVAATRPEPGGWVRLTRFDVNPKRAEEAIAAYEDVALPWLEDAPGFSRALLMLHAGSGRAITESVWLDEGALAASRSADAVARGDAAAAADASVRALEEYRLLLSSPPRPAAMS